MRLKYYIMQNTMSSFSFTRKKKSIIFWGFIFMGKGVIKMRILLIGVLVGNILKGDKVSIIKLLSLDLHKTDLKSKRISTGMFEIDLLI